MPARVVTFGEIMLRLKSVGFERFLQQPLLEATFGGGEANVAVSCANFGMDAAFVTALPNNDIAEACLKELRGFGVDVSRVVRKEGRMGVYFVEAGAVQRASKVIYDRADSVIARARPGDIDFSAAFEGATWFHITGITPAISDSARLLALESLEAAKRAGLTVSLDLNYRKNLWKYGKTAAEVMPDLVKYTDIVIANEEDVQMALGISADSAHKAQSGEIDEGLYEQIAKSVINEYPNVKLVAITLRESKSASHNDWSACAYNGAEFMRSRRYEITHIVDRVGGGDSFSAGLIYGLNAYGDVRRALEFAVAASCLKHTIPGDYNRVSVKEVESLIKGGGSGRVQR